MKLSVAICTFNGGRYLREQLESIAAQTRGPDELIICDDRSTDDTVRIVESFAAGAPFPVRLSTNEQNLGSTKNFERAITLCEGDVIFLSDQDDVWHPRKVQRFEAEFVSRANVAMVFSDGEVVDENLRPLGHRVWALIRFGERERTRFARGDAFKVLLDHNVVTGAAMAFRSKFKNLILPIPGDLTHDGVAVLHDWWAALMIAAVADAAFIDEPLFQYRQHGQQQMGVSSGFGAKADARQPGESSVSEALYRPNCFSQEIRYLRAIAARLAAADEAPRDRAVLAEVSAKLTHLEARAAMPKSRWRRLPSVVRELFTLRYHAHSRGVYSAAKDLWLGNGGV